MLDNQNNVGSNLPMQASSFQRLMELVSAIKPEEFPADLSPKDAFLAQLEPALAEQHWAHEDLWMAAAGRYMTLDEAAGMDSGASGSALLLDLLRSRDFRMSLPARLRALCRFKIDYYLHVPKTGGMSFINNILYKSAYPVWNIEPEGHDEFVFSDLPRILERTSATRKLVVHSHLFFPHVLQFLNLDSTDEVIVTIRPPVSIHFSNANYIYERLRSMVGDGASGSQIFPDGRAVIGDAVIDGSWQAFLDCCGDFRSKASSLIRILNAPEYQTIYGEILFKYFFGECIPEPGLIEKGLRFALRRFRIYPTTSIDHVLRTQYGVGEPSRYNEASGEAVALGDIARDVEWARIIGVDDRIYARLIEG